MLQPNRASPRIAIALPVAAHSSLLPAEPLPAEPVVARPPAEPLDAEPDAGSGGSPMPATAVPLDPVRRVAPTKAAITAERITRCVFLVEPGERPSDAVPCAPQSTEAGEILKDIRFTFRRLRNRKEFVAQRKNPGGSDLSEPPGLLG